MKRRSFIKNGVLATTALSLPSFVLKSNEAADNVFKMKDAEIGEVMRQIARWYDASIIYEEIPDRHFNGTIERDVPVSKLLKLLEGTGDVHFKVEEKKITISK